GAAQLAAEIGLPAEDLLTPEAERVWREGVEGRLPPESSAKRLLDRVHSLISDPERAAGTVDFLALDDHGHLASAVSTSGWAWKYPGRLGDSPVIGAGNYCDDRYGAAACTGWGELAIRAGTARSVVAALAAGAQLDEACALAMADVVSLPTNGPEPLMHLVAIDRHGHHVAMSTKAGTEYVYRADGMPAAARGPRVVVAGRG
ncbi:MAG: isoaspartyl peptidase/L-asparaginase, partial [Acidimicrobiales bacterium]